MLRAPASDETQIPQNKYRAKLIGRQIWLSFPHDPTVLGFIKRVIGGQWEQERKEKPTAKGRYPYLNEWLGLVLALGDGWKLHVLLTLPN